MQDFLNSISAVMLLLLMASMGYFCGAMGWMGREHKRFLVRYIIDLAMPCMCVNSLMGVVTRDMLREAGGLLLVPLLSIGASFLVAWAAARLLRIGRKSFGVFMSMCAVTNSMFIGYPMCLHLFGEASVFFVLCFYLVNTSFFQILGIGLLNYSGQGEGSLPGLKATVKGLIKPPVCATLACIALILLGWELPPLVMRLASSVGATVTPLALLFTGFVIYDTGLKNLKLSAPLAVMLLLRFVVSPLLCLLFCTLLGLEGLARNVMLVQAAMPVMTQVIVLAADCGADEEFAAAGTALSTLACFVVIPVLMMLL